ncbi:MAG: lactate utilization protein [Verrucomicrobiae bacterium]|nr:lactate utilization protein [Verrucomicrobiae bacterium]
MTATARQFHRAANARAFDLRHRAIVAKNTATYHAAVARGLTRFADWEAARSRAAAIKRDAINHLDRYLEQFEQNIIARGGHVYWAETGAEAVRQIIEIARQHGVRKAVKSKSMLTEEIHLNPALEAAGITVLETDLGEYICQLRGEPPYHIVTPVMHLNREQIAQTFHERFGTPLDATAEQLAAIAREKLRAEFLTADMGITGANFAVADPGMISLCTNEGNARLTTSLPRVHVAVIGIEKIVPHVEDLALFWPLLATRGTGQFLTVYNTLIGGSDKLHVILLDNGRTRLLSDLERRDALHCIRCGACLNACPVYRTVGGHTYGTTYQGPLGCMITPHLRGWADWSHLPYASSLCGKCSEVCPVGIPIHHRLLENRRDVVRNRFDPWYQRLAIRLWWVSAQSATLFALAGKVARWCTRLGIAKPLARPWTKYRDLPSPPQQAFREWWKNNERT